MSFPARSSPYSIVADTSFLGKSLAVTSPPTAIACPPACLISSTTAWAFSTLDRAGKVEGKARTDQLQTAIMCRDSSLVSLTLVKVSYDDFCAFFREEKSGAAANSLSRSSDYGNFPGQETL